MEALQVQVKTLKNNEEDLLKTLTSFKTKVDNRDEEIEKLRAKVRVLPEAPSSKAHLKKDGSYIPSDVKNRIMDLKASEMQLEVLQRRNQILEERLKTNICKYSCLPCLL